MKMQIIFLCFVLSLVACAPNYSNGTRVGVVTKLSEKGIIWKSWEGEMLMALPKDVASGAQPEKFEFNVDPPCVQKVELVYRQWAISPPSIDADHVVIDVKDAQ